MEPTLTVCDTLRPLLDELIMREPLFHAAAPEAAVHHFEALVAPEFWEIGASGRRYSRSFALRVLEERERLPDQMVWKASEYHLREIAPQTYLLTYILTQSDRTTLRSTIWQKRFETWKVLFHQGTPLQEISIDYKMLQRKQ